MDIWALAPGKILDAEGNELEVNGFRPMVEMPAAFASTIETPVQAQFRHRAKAAQASFRREGERAWVTFGEAQRAGAPGQGVVIYEGRRTLGAGWLVAAS